MKPLRAVWRQHICIPVHKKICSRLKEGLLLLFWSDEEGAAPPKSQNAILGGLRPLAGLRPAVEPPPRQKRREEAADLQSLARRTYSVVYQAEKIGDSLLKVHPVPLELAVLHGESDALNGIFCCDFHSLLPVKASHKSTDAGA